MSIGMYMVLTLIAGIVIGIVFFGGLWFTVKQMAKSKTPTVWLIVSFIFRVSITLLGFYFIAVGSWQRLLICVAGFIAARYLVTHFTKGIDDKAILNQNKVGHET